MKRLDLNQTLSAIANIAIIAGIAFLAYELRQNTLATRLGVVQSYSENLAAVNYLIASDGELAILLAESVDAEFNLDDLGPGERLRLQSFWTAQLREWESTYNVFVASGLANELDSSFRENVAFYMGVDPNIYPTWQTIRGAFSEQFNDLIEEVADGNP